MTPHPRTAHEQDWINPLGAGRQEDILAELSDIEDLMSGAGHHGPLRDTIPALIAEAADLDAAYSTQFRTNARLALQLIEARSQVNHQTAQLNASEEHARMLEARARWVIREAMSYCVTEIRPGDDD